MNMLSKYSLLLIAVILICPVISWGIPTDGHKNGDKSKGIGHGLSKHADSDKVGTDHIGSDSDADSDTDPDFDSLIDDSNIATIDPADVISSNGFYAPAMDDLSGNDLLDVSSSGGPFNGPARNGSIVPEPGTILLLGTGLLGLGFYGRKRFKK